MKVNETKSAQVTFTLKKNTCTPVQTNNKQLAQPEGVKCMDIHLDRKLIWYKHIFTKRKQLDLKLRKLYWIIGRKSQLSLGNKLLVYKAILNPIWTYGVQLWGSTSNSNIETLESFQSEVLRIITDAPWYVPNAVIKLNLKKSAIGQARSAQLQCHRHRLDHSNRLAISLFQRTHYNLKLKWYYPADLSTRF
jgi:hypothetical protein